MTKILLGFALMVLAGCTSGPVVRPEATPAPGTAVPGVATGEQMIEINSEPVGARIIVNDQSVGRAPLRLVVKVTPQGFSTNYLTIKARFVAENATQASQTVETELTPLEKVPATISFSPQGMRRRMR